MCVSVCFWSQTFGFVHFLYNRSWTQLRTSCDMIHAKIALCGDSRDRKTDNKYKKCTKNCTKKLYQNCFGSKKFHGNLTWKFDL